MLLSPVSSKIGGFNRLLALTLPTDVPVGIIRGIYVFTKTIHLIVSVVSAPSGRS